jgi:hypothetical protein
LAGIYVEILGNASQFKRELDSAVAATAKANSGFRKMGRVAGVAGLALGGVLAVGLDKSVHAAMDAQVSTARLDQAFKTAGMSADNYKAQIEKAETASRNLGFAGNETKTALGSFMVATHDVTKSVKDLAIAEDLARFKGVDLQTATKMLTSASAGNARAIKQLGIMLVPTTAAVDKLKNAHVKATTAAGRLEYAHARLQDKMATAASAVDLVRQKVEGQGEAYSKTAAGSLQVFHENLQHLEVTLGTMLLPAIVAVTEKLSVFAGFLAKHKTLTEALVIGLGALAGALLAVSAAAAIADLAMSPILLPLAAVVIAVGALSFAVYKLVTDFQNSWPLLLPIVLGPLGLIIAAVIHWHSQIGGAFSAGWEFVKGLTGRAWEWIKGAIGDALHWIGDKISEGFHHDIDAITNLGPAFLNAAKGLGDRMVSGIVNGLADLVGKVTGEFARLWSFVKGLASEAFSIGKEIGSAIVHGIISGLEGLASRMAGIVQGAISHLPHISIPGHSPIEHVGHHIGMLISNGMIRGLQEGSNNFHAQLVDGIKTAKAGVDDWIDTAGVANMTERGQVLAKALAEGFSGGGLALVGAGVTGRVASANPDALMANAPSSGGGGVAEIHTHVYLDGKQITETVRRELIRTQNRNGNLGFT